MNEKTGQLMLDFTEELSKLSQSEKIYYTNQFILNLMDYTEQSDDEKLWCNLYSEFQKLIGK